METVLTMEGATLITEREVIPGSPQLLRECVFMVPEIIEDSGPNKKALRFRGKFGQVDASTANRRYYPKRIIEANIKRLRPDMEQRGFFSELDHPLEPGTKLQRTSHLVTNLEVQPNGDVYGEAEVLPTPAGKILEALIQSRCRIGVSSRGYGSTAMDEAGKERVGDDYVLTGYDVVADPAAAGSYPTAYYEALQAFQIEALKETTVPNETKPTQEQQTTPPPAAPPTAPAPVPAPAQVDPALRAQVVAEERAKFAQTLVEELAKNEATVREQVKSELLSDPAVAGAKSVLESLKTILKPYVLPADAASVVTAKDAEIAKLRNEAIAHAKALAEATEARTAIEAKAKVFAYELYVERALRGNPEAADIITILGPVGQLPDADTLKKRFNEAKDLHEKRKTALAEAKAAQTAKEEELQKKLDAAKEANVKLEAQATELGRLSLRSELMLLALDNSINEAHRVAVRTAFEGRDVRTREQALQIVENTRKEANLTPDQARENARRGAGGRGQGQGQIDEGKKPGETPAPQAPVDKNFNGLGASAEDIIALADGQG